MVSVRISFILSLALVLGFCAHSVYSYDPTRSDNLAVYWGQDSYGATHATDTANFQKNLSYYCQDNSIDAFPMAFVDVFIGTGGLPSIDLSNICSGLVGPNFPGTELPDCSFLAPDIETCQAQGKIVTMSFGGATGSGSFSSAQAASDYADLVWNIFLGGTSSTRPFGSAVLDGIDLDIEGGSTTYYDTFLARLQSYYVGASKTYYTTGAPQCPFPDGYMGTLLNQASFDAIYVQFYNNYCGVAYFNDTSAWDFGAWDTWAKTQSVNKNVKVFIGAPAAPSAANTGSYVDVNTLGSIATATRSAYSSFGGIMLWDASQAYVNGRYDAAIKNLIRY